MGERIEKLQEKWTEIKLNQLKQYELKDDQDQIKLYKKRWMILTIFMIYSISSGLQWMQYSIVTNIVKKFYQVEDYAVEWTTMIHMLAFVILNLPFLRIMEKAGNRMTMLLASGGVTLGSWIKLFAVKKDAFLFVLIGQGIEAVAQVFSFALAGRISATWFGSKEISLAGSLALFGDQLGYGLGYLLPPYFVHNSDDPKEIGQGIYDLCLVITILSSISFVLIVYFFSNTPEKPPSIAQLQRLQMVDGDNIIRDFKKIMTREGFLLTLITYGLLIGGFDCHGTLLNRVFGFYFPSREKDAGTIGCLVVLCGIIGSTLSGYYLDWKHTFKETSCFLYIGTTICMASYTYFLFSKNLIMVYLMACILGILMFGFYSAGMQLAIELAHPYSEGSVVGLAFLAIQTTGFLMTPIYRLIFETFGPLEANSLLVLLFLIGSIFSSKIPTKYHRQKAEMTYKSRKHNS